MKKLLRDISKHKKLIKTTDDFIKLKNIKKYNFKKRASLIDENDLPINTIMGSTYLIKGNNIIEIYSWYDVSHSLCLQISLIKSTWMSKVFIVNKEVNDPDNIEFILEGSKIFYASTELNYLILQFIQDGFNLYV